MSDAGIVQSQSGNPVNIAATNSTVNDVAGTLRPDVNGPISIPAGLTPGLMPAVFTSVAQFGDLGRPGICSPPT